MAHAYKHFADGGCGVRHVADEWVFLQARGAEVDWGFVESEMGAMGMGGFEHALRRAAGGGVRR